MTLRSAKDLKPLNVSDLRYTFPLEKRRRKQHGVAPQARSEV
jgi:hypothetical protein